MLCQNIITFLLAIEQPRDAVKMAKGSPGSMRMPDSRSLDEGSTCVGYLSSGASRRRTNAGSQGRPGGVMAASAAEAIEEIILRHTPN